MTETYADQWQACADLMRQKANEFEELARKAPKRPLPKTEADFRSALEDIAELRGGGSIARARGIARDALGLP